MKNKIYYIFLPLIIFACHEDTNIINEPQENLYINQIEIKVIDCKTVSCQDIDLLAGIDVKFFDSENDALQNQDPIAIGITNTDGILTISLSNKVEVYIQILHPQKGNYIARERLGPTVTKAYHEVRFVANFIYNNNATLALKQNHISFELPAVGQISRYRFYENIYEGHMNIPETYDAYILEFVIVDQLAPNKFVIEERMDSLPPSIDWRFNLVHQNIWTFHPDHIEIQDVAGESNDLFSMILNNHLFHSPPNNKVNISLTPCNEHIIDFGTTYFYEINWQFCQYSSAFVLNEFSYGPQQIYYDSYVGLDGDDIIVSFSKQNGISRAIFINQMSNAIRGFDLIL